MVPPVILWWVWIAFVVLNIADFVAQGVSSPRLGAVVSAILLLVTGLMYTLALRPRVVIGERELTIRNPFRTYHIPWPLIHAVDTGEWVRVHYAPGGPEVDTAGSGDAAGSGNAAAPVSSAGDKKVYCWALYVSARARRKIARGTARPRGRGRGLSALIDSTADSGQSARMPQEARYLASLPVAKAMATRLDSHAERERAKAKRAGSATGTPLAAAASWTWPDIAFVAIPAVIVLIVAVL